MNAKKRPSLLAGALLVVAVVGCSGRRAPDPERLTAGLTRDQALAVAGEPTRKIEQTNTSTWRWERPGYLVDLAWRSDNEHAFRSARVAQP